MVTSELGRKAMRIMMSMRFAFGLVFLISGLSHVNTAATNPEEYREFSKTALVAVYSDLIDSVSVSMMPAMVGLVGLYEVVLGVLMLNRGFLVKIGLVMGIVFALAISLLGPEELPALLMVPLFGYLLTKEFRQSLLSAVRARLGPSDKGEMALARDSSDSA